MKRTLALLAIVTALIFAAGQSFGQLTMTGVGTFKVAAPAGSAWGDHGLNVTVSTTTVPSDTVTGGAGNGGAFSSVRGTQAYSAGKVYFEVKALTAPGTAILIVGMMDDTTANGAAMDSSSLAKSSGHSMFNGNENSNVWTGVNLGAGFSLSNNDVLAVAADFDNAFYYLALGSPPAALVWFLSGDPTSGATGTGHVGIGVRVAARPMLSLFGVANGVFQLRTAAFDYAPPAGYSAWNYLLKRDVTPEAANDNSPMWIPQVA